jgi:ribosome recycling factor
MEKEIQDLVNDYNKKIESLLKEKEEELLSI